MYLNTGLNPSDSIIDSLCSGFSTIPHFFLAGKTLISLFIYFITSNFAGTHFHPYHFNMYVWDVLFRFSLYKINQVLVFKWLINKTRFTCTQRFMFIR